MKRLLLIALACIACGRSSSAGDDPALIKAMDEVRDGRVLVASEQNFLMTESAKFETVKTVLAQRLKRLSDLCEKRHRVMGEVQQSGDGIGYTVTGCVDKPKAQPSSAKKNK